jgi:hypothetical protein
LPFSPPFSGGERGRLGPVTTKGTTMTYVRTFHGVNIWRNGPGFALRYTARLDNGQRLAADTLAGIKALIREGSSD